MASNEHKLLSQYIKDVHLSLRKSTLKFGVDTAWRNHCSSEDILTKYAQCMNKLATTHWESNCNDETSGSTSRIKWVVDFCSEYFTQKSHMKYTEKELNIAQRIGVYVGAAATTTFSYPLQLLDVGSCYNPFKVYNIFNVLAIDLYPANASVLQCDFLSVKIGPYNITEESKVTQIQEESSDIVTFCFLLEYLPSSELRIKACEKAYRILKPGGLLIINTPDSKHIGANSRIIKCWRYTLAHIGFNRIKYEKTKYMHCMAFRKSLNREVSKQWALTHNGPFMKYAIHIPQDFNFADDVFQAQKPIDKESVTYDFQELPFFDPEEKLG